MKFYRYITIMALFTIFGCKSTKTVTSSQAPKENASIASLVKAHNKAEPKFKTLQSKLKITYSQGEKSQTHTLTFRMKKDEVIWMSATLAMVRAKITPEKVSFYNKLDNTYFDGDFSYLSSLLGTELDFNQLQNLLLGQALNTLDKDTYKSEVFDTSYMLQPKAQTDIFEAFYMLNPEHFKLDSQQFGQSKEQRLLQIDYLKYQELNGQTFPLNTKIIALEKDEETIIELEFKSLKLNENLRFPFKIPSGFKPIELE